jgi:hypothetical protein
MVPQNFSRMNCGAMNDNNNSMMMPSPAASNLTVGDGNGPAIRSPSANRIMLDKFVLMSSFLDHRRWIWSIQQSSTVKLSVHIIGRILSVISRLVFVMSINLAGNVLVS